MQYSIKSLNKIVIGFFTIKRAVTKPTHDDIKFQNLSFPRVVEDYPTTGDNSQTNEMN